MLYFGLEFLITVEHKLAFDLRIVIYYIPLPVPRMFDR